MFQNLTPVVKNLLIINVLVYLALVLLADRIPELADWFRLCKVNWLGLRTVGADGNYIQQIDGEFYSTPTGPSDFRPIQLLTHFFAHDIRGIMHILFNMLMLFMIGPWVERAIGSKRFLHFYLFSGLVGGVIIAVFDPSAFPVVGASGALSGVLVAFGSLFPNEKMIIFPIPVPIKAINLVWGYAAFSIVMLLISPNAGGVSHFGHLAGMIAAVLYYLVRRYLPI